MTHDLTIELAEHRYLDVAALIVDHSASDATFESDRVRPDLAGPLLSLDATATAASPFAIHNDQNAYQTVKSAVRDLLRQHGYKPTGRGKPASEYLVRAINEAKLGRINPIVDTLNAVSLHSGLPISVIDLDRANLSSGQLKVDIAGPNTAYTFNVSGQTMKLDGLLCLFDTDGPCANAVKDSQRTKTCDQTRRSLVVIWGSNQLVGHTEKTQDWFDRLVVNQNLGIVSSVTLQRS